MNPDKQRIAIAEACGWQMIQRPLTDQDGEIPGHVEVRWFHPKIHTSVYPLYALPQNPPDYLNDLNAMHEAVVGHINTPGFCGHYNRNLATACRVSGRDVRSKMEDFLIHNATAAQRAEAFLRTIGKWEDPS